MWYAIFGEDVPNSLELRKQLRPDHLARLEPLKKAGRVLLAGPHPAQDPAEGDDQVLGFTGSLMVVDFPNLEQAKEWAAQDPYKLGGVFAKVSVKPFTKVLP